MKRIRGISVCCKVSPTLLTRVIESSRFILNQCIPDVYITADHYSGATSGHSAGYSILLTSESNTGAVISVERTAEQGELPENVGREAALLLLQVANSFHYYKLIQITHINALYLFIGVFIGRIGNKKRRCDRFFSSSSRSATDDPRTRGCFQSNNDGDNLSTALN